MVDENEYQVLRNLCWPAETGAKASVFTSGLRLVQERFAREGCEHFLAPAITRVINGEQG